MNCCKKSVMLVLAAVLFFQNCILHTAASGMFRSDSYGSSEIVPIDILSGEIGESDFVVKFPKRLYVNEKKLKFPVEEWEPVTQWNRDEIPMIFQEDYPDARYGTGTVETCGSGITALAMVATYLTGYDYYPDEMARWFAGKANEDVGRLTYGAKSLNLPFETTEDWTDAFGALKNGRTLIVQFDRLSMFVDSEEMDAQHFLILTGMTKDEKIVVQDPCGAHYVAEDLQEGFLTGFGETDISTGFRYAWIFNKSAVPKNIERFSETYKTTTQNRYTKLKLTPAEKQLLARLVAVNAGGECSEGQQAMVEVLLNRLLSSEFPNDLKDLVFGEEPVCDVHLLNDVQLTSTQYLAVERAINGPYLLTTNVTDFTYQCHK